MYTAKVPFYFINVLLHLAFYYVFTIYLFKKDFRFSNSKTLLLTALYIAFFCVCDVLFFERGAPLGKLKYIVPAALILSVVVSFAYTMLVVKNHYFQLLFMVLICFTFHANQIALAGVFTHFFPIASIISWFPEFNYLLVQLLILAIFIYPMWYLSNKLFSKVIDNGIDFLQWKFTVLLPLALFGLSLMFNIFVLYKTGNGYVEIVLSILLMLSSYFAYLSVVKIWIISDEKHREEEKTAVASKQIELQKANFEHLNEYIQNTARERHDFRQHFCAIKGLVYEGNIDKAKEYLTQYETQHVEAANVSVCVNKSVDAILAHYIGIAKNANVAISANVAIGEDIAIDDIELCIVVGNLVENAVEACLRQTSDDKFIDIKSHVVGEQLLFIVTNSFNGDVMTKDGELCSVKSANRMGIGLDSARKIVEKHGGSLDVGIDGSRFKVSALLNLD